MANQYPTLQVRLDQQTKQDLFTLAKLRGTTPSAMVKAFIQQEVASLGREKRAADPAPDFDFLG